jgi:hypothetical protein
VSGDQEQENSMISQAKLDFWIQNHYNVLFVGRHGVGKTATIKEAFERAGLKWKYFSAATMDPWVDFIGVPKEMSTPEGLSYLDLVRPFDFQTDTVEAIFFDEFNRSHKKVRNAVMELIQFRSINGKKFNNLKLIWAAINPDDEGEYDVEKLDPAQEDRFHVKVVVPYKPDLRYFTKIYGENIARAALGWWQDLPVEQKDAISPRRLDYALDILDKSGDLRDALPPKVSVVKLLSDIKNGPIVDRLDVIFKNRDDAGALSLMREENSYVSAISHILKKQSWLEYFLPFVSKEKLVSLISEHEIVLKTVVVNSEKIEIYKIVLSDIIKANANKKLVKKIRANMEKNHIPLNGISPILPRQIGKPIPGIYNKNLKDVVVQKGTTVHEYADKLASDIQFGRNGLQQTYQRNRAIGRLLDYVPATMNTIDALSLIKAINAYAIRSHFTTVARRAPMLLGIFNHCIAIISSNESLDWKGIVSSYGINFSEFMEKLGRSKFVSQVYYPNNVKAAI